MPYVNDAVQEALDLAAGEASSFADSIGTVGTDTEGIVQEALAVDSREAFRKAEITAQNLANNAGNIRERVTANGEDETDSRGAADATDLRIHLKAQAGVEHQVYGPNEPSNLLGILHSTQGILFPYTPSIEWSQSVDYSTTSLTHSNQDFLSYKSTPSTTLRVSGEFTVQNYREAQYMMAVIHFLRVASKMFFGKKQDNYPSGMPPPVLTFSGYGNFMFNDLPVIVRNHAYSLPKDVDYIDVNVAGGKVRLPSILTVSMELTVQNTPKKHREEFNLDKFRTGELMLKKKGWI